jgi:hypothetical protein
VDFVQPVEDEPRSFDPESSLPYGTGAVLGAGAQILRLLDREVAVDSVRLRDEAEQLVEAAPDLSR